MVAKFAKECTDAKCSYLIIEITSHGYYQYRTWGIKPILLGITNVTHEHLDYHINLEEYFKAKAGIAQNSRFAMMAEFAPGYDQIKLLIKNLFGFTNNQFISAEIKNAINERFRAKYNRDNAQLAAHMAEKIGVDPQIIAAAIKSFPGVIGRMEEIPNQLGFRTIVDFAHTPNGLESALKALRQQLKAQNKLGRLIAIYGSAGLRDYQKRPLMGKIGTQLADLAIFTAEDPRTENIWSIIRQMKEQLATGHDKVVSIADRGQAITFGITHARKNDIVVVLGKGHERTMCFGKTEVPWSDQDYVRKVIQGS